MSSSSSHVFSIRWHPKTAAPFHLVIEGRCDVHVDGRIIEMREGDMVILLLGKQHEPPIRSAASELKFAADADIHRL